MTTLHLRHLINRSPLRRGCLLIAFAFCCFSLSPAARAVTPAPDGGYTGFNTAEGANALFSLTTGSFNTAIGGQALYGNTTGSFNTAVGGFTLAANSLGYQNVAIGQGALRYNTIGYQNTGTGYQALLRNTEGYYNTANGFQALYKNTGDINFDYGNRNTATGYQALYSNDASDNTATGYQALYSNDGSFNTAHGSMALYSNTDGSYNTAVGYEALVGNTTGNINTATGYQALYYNTIGYNNTATGFSALLLNTRGANNTANGVLALENNTTGSDNIALGSAAGHNLTTGSHNIDIGNEGMAGESATIRIGTGGVHSRVFIAGISVGTGLAVVQNNSGQLGVAPSSARFKDAIKPMDKASEGILALKPVTFRYKKDIDPDTIPQFGLVAEEVEKVNPALVTRDAKGEVYTVRYEAVNAMLLNEFLKEHKTVQEQGATITRLQKQIEALTAGLQKVSAQLEARKPASQIANNP